MVKVFSLDKPNDLRLLYMMQLGYNILSTFIKYKKWYSTLSLV